MESSFAHKLTKWSVLTLVLAVTLILGSIMPVIFGPAGLSLSVLIGFVGGGLLAQIGLEMDRYPYV